MTAEEIAEEEIAEEEAAPAVALWYRSLTGTCGRYSVSVSGYMPFDARLVLSYANQSAAETVLDAAEVAGIAGEVADFVALDVTLVDGEGRVWQPEQLGVTVRIGGFDVSESDRYGMVHVLDDAAAIAASGSAVALYDELVASTMTEASLAAQAATGEEGAVYFEDAGAEATDEGLSADVDSLSTFIAYTVDFHNGDLVFSIPGESSILLSEVFANLGYDYDVADVASVSFSDPTLLSVEAVEGDWLLTSLEPFDTDETLTIVFKDGSELAIWVTDRKFDTAFDYDGTWVRTESSDVTTNKAHYYLRSGDIHGNLNSTNLDDGTAFTRKTGYSSLQINPEDPHEGNGAYFYYVVCGSNFSFYGDQGSWHTMGVSASGTGNSQGVAYIYRIPVTISNTPYGTVREWGNIVGQSLVDRTVVWRFNGQEKGRDTVKFPNWQQDVAVDQTSGQRSRYYYAGATKDGNTIYVDFYDYRYVLNFDANGGTLSTTQMTSGPNAERSHTFSGFPTPTPPAGYSFVGWSDTDVAPGTSATTFTSKTLSYNNGTGGNTGVRTATVHAVYSENTVNIYYSAGTGGSVSPTSESLKAITGSANGSTATASSGYHFVGWYTAASGGTLLSTAAKYVPQKNSSGAYEAKTYYARFESNYRLTGTIDHGGTVTNASQTVAPGVNCQPMTFTPATGYKITGITINGAAQTVTNENSYVFPAQVLTTNTTVAVTTAKKTFQVICEDRVGSTTGTLIGTQAAKTYEYGATARGSDWGTSSPYDTYRYVSDTSATVTGATTVYRIFELITCSVTGTIDHGTVTNSSQTILAGGSSQAMVFTPATGYEIATITVNGSTRNATAAEKAGYTYPAQSNVTSNITVAVTTTPIQYTITYDPNGGSFTSSTQANPQPYTIESTDTLAGAQRNGFTFDGWKVTTAGGSWIADSVHSAGDAVTGNYGNVTLTAQWLGNSCKVTLDNQGADSGKEGSTYYYYRTDYKEQYLDTDWWVYYYRTAECAEDDSIFIGNGNTWTITKPEKTGYTFAGYFTAQNGQGRLYVLPDGECQNNIWSTSAADKYVDSASDNPNGCTAAEYLADTGHDITLYAFWIPNTYTITYDLDGGNFTSTQTNPQPYTIESTDGLAGAQKTGYRFDGWTVTETDTVSSWVVNSNHNAAEAVTNNYGNVKLQAQWTPIDYVISYELDGGSYSGTAPANPQTYTIEDTAVPLAAAPEKAGYVFDGWMVTDTETESSWTVGNKYDASASFVGPGLYGNVELTAQWRGTTSTVTIKVVVDGLYANLTHAFTGTPEIAVVTGGSVTPAAAAYALTDGQTVSYTVTAGESVQLKNVEQLVDYTLTATVKRGDAVEEALTISAAGLSDLIAMNANADEDILITLTYVHTDIPETGVDGGLMAPIPMLFGAALLLIVVVLFRRRRGNEA